MRKPTICLLLLLCSLAAFGQSQPQWRVVQSIILPNQTAPITQTTLFTPTEAGLYRLTVYISATALSSGEEWSFGLIWTDLVEQNPFTLTVSAVRNGPGTITSIFSPRRNTPVSFQVEAENSPPPNSHYNLAFTVEQLK